MKSCSHTILLIEDDKVCLFAQKSILSELTCNINSVETVKEAFKKLAAKRYDLVLSNLRLPDGSGNDIVAKIKTTPESLNYQTPFVMITAEQDPALHKEAIKAGFSIVWVKPLEIDKVVAFLKKPDRDDSIDLFFHSAIIIPKGVIFHENIENTKTGSTGIRDA